MRISDWSSDVCSSDLTGDAETVEAILEEAGKVTSKSVAPLSRAADEEGCHWADGAVTTPAGFPQAYKTYAEGGWVGVGGDPAYGGMGMPKAVSAQVEEMVNSASLSFRSEEHTSELKSLMRISYAVFCLQKTNKTLKSA